MPWACAHIVPRVATVAAHHNYLYRITAIYAVRDLSALFGPAASAEHLLPFVLKLAADIVPNIRFNVAKLFAAFANPPPPVAASSTSASDPSFDPATMSSFSLPPMPVVEAAPWPVDLLVAHVRPALVKLSEDADGDVRFFALQALALPSYE